VNAAGNEAERQWKGSFADTNADGWLDQSITFQATAGSSVVIFLTWNEWPQASTDYDLYLYGPGDTLIASSTKYQTGTEEPTESIQVTTTLSGVHSIRIRGTGSRTLELFNLYQPLTPAIPDSSILAPGNVASVVTVAALGQSQYTTGPIESYSSRGPTNDFRPKPDLAAPVNVTTGTSPYTTFPGTSAAAPHAAAAAALLRSQTPSLSGSNLRLALLSHTVPMGSVYEYGNGRLRLQPPAAANQPPTAAFTVSPSSGAPGTLFTLDGTSSTDPDGSLVSYQWSFGDGNSGSGPMVSHSYASAGTYTVQLTVTDNEGATNTAARSVSVVSTARPDLVVSGMTASPTNPTIGQSVAFSITVQNQGSASAGSFRVRLSGSSSSTYGYVSQLPAGASQLLALTLPLGTSSETFTATADDLTQVLESNETNNTRSLTVTAGVTPVVARAGGPYAGTAGAAIAFNGTASTGQITTYQWTFGDGSTAYGATPSHTYGAPGTYSVTLTVFGSGGQQSTETTQAVISTATPALSAQLSLPKSTYQVGEAIIVTYTLNRPAYVYICDVTPDGRVTLLFPNWRESSPSVAAGTRTFPGTTTYTVQVTEPTGTETLYLFAAAGPIAGFPTTFSAAFPLLSTNPSGFRNAVLANMQSQYSSGDRVFDTLSFTISPATPTTGSIRVTSSPSGAQVRIDGALVGTTTHEQPNVAPGLHTVEVSRSGYQTVTQQVNVVAGQTSQVSVTLSAIPTNQPPTAAFSFTPAGPTAGDTVSFDASASSDPDGTIVSYAWAFGDGNTGSGQFVTHAFTASGSYSVQLTVTDNQGASRSVTKSVSVVSSADVGWVSPVAHTGTGATWTASLVDRAYDYDADDNFRSSARHDPLSRDQWTANLILHAPSGGVQSDRVRLLVADSSVGGNELAWVVDVERDGGWVNVYTGTAGSLREHDSSEELEWVEIGFDQGLVTRIRMRAYLARDMVTRARVFEVMLRDATVAP
jgi:PKD repeat protein